MKNQNKLLAYEHRLMAQGYQRIAGIDEVGRGPLAGGVLACACMLDLDTDIEGINDSKKLSEKKRMKLTHSIQSTAKAYAYGYCNEKEVDDLNIYQASKLAMLRAVKNLKIKPDFLLVDAMNLDIDIPQLSVIKGDTLSASIGAASILAKVKRDFIMVQMDHLYPGYGFNRHKGYPTKYHLQQLKKLRPCKIHRRTYKPVKDLLEEQLSLELEG
ncbi:MAG TPA: ribonuclease HII [Candidatus Izemoplasmatales bacterium]|nr:ribonuclease HII [Candidatus Izemoplasmatales bacterium]